MSPTDALPVPYAVSWMVYLFLSCRYIFNAERQGCALLGKQVVPDNLPFVTGPMGLLGSKASDQMIKKCDTLMMIGSTFPYVEYLPKEGAVKAVQIDIAPRNFAEGFPGLSGRTEWFAVEYRGTICTTRAGKYVFRVLSDDGARLVFARGASDDHAATAADEAAGCA